MALPYAKFFNAGEPNAPALDWSSASVYEKRTLSFSLACQVPRF